MDDDYWNSSSVTDKVSRQGIFDTDGTNTLDDRILDSSRSTPTAAISNRSRPTTTETQTKVNNIPKSNHFDKQPVQSARFGRSQNSSTSNESYSNAQWLPNAEEYPDQTTKDQSTQYDKEMEILCKNLLENQPVKLDVIRDYDKKASLLRIAISFNTPSVTVPVMIFLENTLSKSLFYELIKKFPLAIKNYMNMAKLRVENDFYISMLKQFGRNEEVAMIRLRQINQTNDFNTKLSILDQAATELSSHHWWRSQIVAQRALLVKQNDLKISQTNQTAFETYKRIYKIDFQRPKQNRIMIDPSKEFETTFHMSPEMMMCGKLSVIMECDLRQHYDDFVQQSTHQGIFGKKSVIAPENLADMVYNWVKSSGEGQDKANEKIERFLTMISDPIKRMYFAEKFQNYDVAIDTIVNQFRDRVELENLRKRMPRDHPSYNRATSLLENTKWRN